MTLRCVVSVSDQIGLGHLVRMRTLIDQLPVTEPLLLVISDWKHEVLESFLPGYEFIRINSFQDAEAYVDQGDLCVLDVFLPAEKVLRQLSARCKLVGFGIQPELFQYYDLVINVAEKGRLLPADETTVNETRVFSGVAFALIRPEFYQPHTGARNSGEIVVCIGGTDAAELTVPVVKHLLDSSLLRNKHLRVVTASNRKDNSVLMNMNSKRISLVKGAPDICSLIAAAEIAVIGPGNLLFESMAMNTPAVCLCQNKKQEQDFSGYPWLIKRGMLSGLEKKIQSILECPRQWADYSEQCQAGKLAYTVIQAITSLYEEGQDSLSGFSPHNLNSI